MTPTRRTFLASAAATVTGGSRPPLAFADRPRTRPPKRTKPPAKKVALVACMRKLILTLNTMLTRGERWNPPQTLPDATALPASR